ncbi:WecB/TagA/CpsF family glycosyltransferase [Candidatus Falkowbacteria bacterium]|nr:WecB/TagA/CpsF family glycosyltransferase [Candidatus Falkowbacteria bacterium]
MKTTILDILLDNLIEPELNNKIEDFLNSNSQHTIFTPNPEFLVASTKDKHFKQILNQSDLNIPDGFGLKLASRFLYNKKLNRHTGIDTLIKICQLASEKGKSVYFLGSSEGVAKKTAQTLKSKFSNLKIAGAESGGKIDLNASPVLSRVEGCLTCPEQSRRMPHASKTIPSPSTLSNSDNIAKINTAEPDILFVALGQIKQEKWISENLSKIPSVRIAMGVGGSFDYISKKTPRAPKLLRIIGLEWLFRLILQPKRIKRIWNAIVVFSWLIFKEKLTKEKSRPT